MGTGPAVGSVRCKRPGQQPTNPAHPLVLPQAAQSTTPAKPPTTKPTQPTQPSYPPAHASFLGNAARSVLINAFCQLVIFLYLLDSETSMVVLFSSGVGMLIEFWKVSPPGAPPPAAPARLSSAGGPPVGGEQWSAHCQPPSSLHGAALHSCPTGDQGDECEGHEDGLRPALAVL